jgi:D-alanyl-D-alanine carboxypeptidase
MSVAKAAELDATAEENLNVAGPGQIPGMWIGVWDPAEGVHVEAYGEAVVGEAAATTEDHSYIGSVTKTFTATAILELVAAGELSLTDTVADVAPDLATTFPGTSAVTIEQLLGMQSGLPEYANTGIILQKIVDDPSTDLTSEEIIGTTFDALGVESPGTGMYSSTNYLILGDILEVITGQPAEAVITDLAQRVGLDNTALQAPGENDLSDPSSHGYINDPGVGSLLEAGVEATSGTDVTDWTVSWGQAAGGAYSTVMDLGAWAGTGPGTALLPVDLGEQRLETTETAADTSGVNTINYGLGIMDFGNGWIGHTGQLIGWESIVVYNTITGAAFIGMVNETGSLTAPILVALSVFPDLADGFS